MLTPWIRPIRSMARTVPAESAAVVLAAAVAMLIVHSAPSPELGRLLIASVAALPLFLAITLLRQAPRAGLHARILFPILYGVAALASAALAWSSWPAGATESRVAWHVGPWLLATYSAPFLAAAWANPRTGQGFSSFIRSVAETTAVVGIFWLCASAAIGTIFAALSGLFDLSFPKAAADTILVVTAASAITVASALARGRSDHAVPRAWRILISMVAAPFVAVMVGMVAVYELVVVLTEQAPKNVLSPLLIATGVIGFLAALTIQSMLDDERRPGGLLSREAYSGWETRLSVRVVRWFPAALLPLLPMALWALWLRLDQYGCTPFRVARLYAVVCLMSIAIAGTWRLIRRRAPVSFEVPALVMVFAALTAVGPWSARNLSLDSQAVRLQVALDRHGIDPVVGAAGRPTSTHLSWEDHAELSSYMEVLIELGGESALRQILRGEVGNCHNTYACLHALGADADNGGAYRFASFPLSGIELPAGRYAWAEVRSWTETQNGDYRLAIRGMSLVLEHRGAPVARAHLDADPGHGDFVWFESPSGERLGGFAAQGDLRYQVTAESSEWDEVRGLWLLPASGP